MVPARAVDPIDTILAEWRILCMDHPPITGRSLRTANSDTKAAARTAILTKTYDSTGYSESFFPIITIHKL